LRKLARKIRIYTKYNFYVDNFCDFFLNAKRISFYVAGTGFGFVEKIARLGSLVPVLDCIKRRGRFKKVKKAAKNGCFLSILRGGIKKAPVETGAAYQN
jgi:hypothetical protein